MVSVLDEDELKLILEKLDAIKLELFRLRAMLLSEEEATDEEKKSIEAAKREIITGQSINLKSFEQELLKSKRQ